jgi:hypothetical protein
MQLNLEMAAGLAPKTAAWGEGVDHGQLVREKSTIAEAVAGRGEGAGKPPTWQDMMGRRSEAVGQMASHQRQHSPNGGAGPGAGPGAVGVELFTPGGTLMFEYDADLDLSFSAESEMESAEEAGGGEGGEGEVDGSDPYDDANNLALDLIAGGGGGQAVHPADLILGGAAGRGGGGTRVLPILLSPVVETPVVSRSRSLSSCPYYAVLLCTMYYYVLWAVMLLLFCSMLAR